MPTKKRRIALSVPEDVDLVLNGISSLTSQPKSALITGLLHQSMPQLQATLEALRMAHEGKTEGALTLMADLLRDAGFKLTEVQDELFDKQGNRP